MFADMAGSLASSLTETPTRLVGAGQCGAGAGQLCSQADIRCQGDLGSPLLAGTHSNTILGLMPGYGGCTTSQYGLFTKLASEYRSLATALADCNSCAEYSDWIQNKLSSAGEEACLAPTPSPVIVN